MDCLTYHYDVGRLGAGPSSVVGSYWSKYFSVDLGAAVRGAALVVRGWTFQHGAHAGETHNLVVVATSDNQVAAYAEDGLRAHSAVTLWARNLGPPVMVPGSNIPNPIGICSSPVLDPANRRMFVLAAEADAAAGGQALYRAYCLDLDTGAVVQSALLQDPGAPGRPTFDGHTVDQRAALNLVNGRVYTGFAAYLAYDLGPYHGWVVSLNADNLYEQWFFPTTRNLLGGGVWGIGGVAAAPDGTLYVATGNATNDDAAYWATVPASGPGGRGDYFIAVLKLGVTWSGWTGSLDALDWYHPTDVKAQNDADLDFGSSSPLILPDIGSLQMLVVSAKNGIYLLNRHNLGHMGGELWSQERVFAGESHSAPAYYLTPVGDNYVYFVGDGLPGLICYRVDVTGSSMARLSEVWRANIDAGDSHGSPTIGNHGTGAAVWIVQYRGGAPPAVLRAYDALSGTELYNSAMSALDSLGDVPHYAPITALASSVFVGTATGFACYGPPVVKHRKELKPELKELKDVKVEKIEVKELKNEVKELKDGIGEKQVLEPPKFKDLVEGGGWQPPGDPYSAIRTIAARIDELEDRLAQQPFIREEERPKLTEAPSEEEPPKRPVRRRPRGPRAGGAG